MLAVQLRDGRPQLLLEGGLEPLKLEVNTTLHNGEWHDLHLRLDARVRRDSFVVPPLGLPSGVRLGALKVVL